ncbi:MAG: hypothetical protein K6F84_07060 [Lachnospiraceae bacterium]|nr:hypothetical protein [Lachnospiraceae bacterium]
MSQYDEIREAIEFGEMSLTYLYEAKNSLEKASNWGWLDIFGGGLIISLIKRSKMQEAKNKMDQAAFYLRRFSEELRDVNLDIKTDGFLSFGDLLFDGVLMDALVQQRIKLARNNVEEAILKVRQILISLRACL